MTESSSISAYVHTKSAFDRKNSSLTSMFCPQLPMARRLGRRSLQFNCRAV